MNIIDFLEETKEMTHYERSEYFNKIKDDELIESAFNLEKRLRER